MGKTTGGARLGATMAMLLAAAGCGVTAAPPPAAPEAPPDEARTPFAALRETAVQLTEGAVPQPFSVTASASASAGTFTATRATDGNVDSEWQSGAVSRPALTLSLDRAVALTGFKLKTNSGSGTYALLTSQDGVTFRTAIEKQPYTGWALQTKALPATVNARYLRFLFENAGQNVMVFEAVPIAPGSLPLPTPVPAAPAAVTAPVAASVGGAFRTLFGNQSVPRIGDGPLEPGYALMKDLGMTTIREGWNWKYIQDKKQKYVTWMSYYDEKAAALARMGVKVQAMVTDTPDWASSDSRYTGKTTFDAGSLGKYTVPYGLNQPIFADGTDVWRPGLQPNRSNYFGAYMYDMVTRYKGKIQYWQIWNEPDFPSGDLTAGVKDAKGQTRYWAGSVQDYVRLLQVGHTIVKGIDPAAKVTLGGLGYEGYLAGILDRGGAKYFDVVDFHAYGTEKTTSNLVLNSAWGFLGRYNALKQVLLQRGIRDKTFSCSESGLSADRPAEQAAYVVKYFATALGLGDVEMAQWAVFTNPGHLNIGLVDGATLKKTNDGYRAYRFATRQLAGAVTKGPVAGVGVQGYMFRRADGKDMYVVWSSTTSATLKLPLTRGQVLDKFGNARAASFTGTGVTLALTAEPLYVLAP